MLPQKGETATGNTQRKFEEKKFGRVALRYTCTQMTDRQTDTLITILCCITRAEHNRTM